MRAHRLLAGGLVAGLLLAGTTGSAAVAAATGPWQVWDATPTGEFRSFVVDDGEWVWTNGIMQSRGANADGLHHEDYYGLLVAGGFQGPVDAVPAAERHATWSAFGVDRWANDGDQELPLDDEAYPEFTGELAEVRLAVDADELFIRFLWNSMPGPTTQLATVTFATQGAPAPDGEWPQGAGVTSPWQAAVTVNGTEGTVTSAGESPSSLVSLGGEVRLVDHAYEVRLPLSALPAGPWELHGGGGLADPADPLSYWAVPAGSATTTSPGSGASATAGSPIWSLLFADDDPWIFTARSEGDLLADGDVTPASIVLDPAVLAARGDVQDAPRSGWLARQYVSAFDFGDGIVKGDPGNPPGPFVLPPEIPLDDAGRSYEYTGRLQPYGMYVPEAYHQRAPGEQWPLLVYLHGLNNFYYEPYGTLFNLPEHLEERGFLFANLLGRGDLSYRGRGELDVMEVLADIQAAYDIDADRIHVMGHSMGSIGSHNLATRNPDLFASGAPAEITASNALIGNLRHVPWMMIGGFEDFLDAGSNTEFTTYGLMSDLGYDVTFYNYLMKTHDSTSISDTIPQMLDLHERSRRVTNPADFTYKRLPGDDHPDLGLVHDGAYQASGLTFADAAVAQTITVESFAIPHAPLDPAAATRTNVQVDEGGPSGRSLADKYVTTPAFGAPVTERNAATVDLDNVAAVTLDVPALGLDVVQGMAVEVETTDAVALTLAGIGTGEVAFLLDGAPVVAATSGASRTINVPAGSHVITLASATVGTTGPAPAPAPAPSPLPATGGGFAVLGAALLGAAVRTRRHRSVRAG